MVSRLLGLPSEQLLSVLELLDHQDAVALAQTCKASRSTVEPLLWKHLELFPLGYHKWKHISQHVSSADHKRRYRRSQGKHPVTFDQYQRWASELLTRLSRLRESSEPRALHLCSPVKTLSAPLLLKDPHDWSILALFRNLERLELVVGRGPEDGPDLADDLLLPKLKHVRLFGYVPPAVLSFTLRSAPTIEYLAVGALDSSRELLGFEAARESEPDYDDIQARHLDLDDLESFDSNVDPRPLRWVPPIVLPMPRLMTLHLCWPTEMDPREYETGRVHHFRRLEEELMQDWVRMIASVAGTLEHLVLDQRPAANEFALEGGPSDEFMRCYSSPSSARTIKYILPMLKDVHFPELKSIEFSGLLVHSSLSIDEARQRQDLVAACEAKDIEARFPLGRRCIYETETGLVYGDDGMGADDF